MSQRIIIDPVTRIEGHAKISIYLDDDGNGTDAQFHVVEFRGFERFCEGRTLGEMPALTARTCGICPVSHLLASAKAGDEILAVRVPPAADKLRRLMDLGQLVQSHALSFFISARRIYCSAGMRQSRSARCSACWIIMPIWPARASACGSSGSKSSNCSALRRFIRRGRCRAACAPRC